MEGGGGAICQIWCRGGDLSRVFLLCSEVGWWRVKLWKMEQVANFNLVRRVKSRQFVKIIPTDMEFSYG
ncbi:hypothetical protein HY3_03490 [Hyphomonas pacifica]|uniref:Uncharacterized protein n=1 Tax=Hyphomonas pacifica TaxID=1280941 RepID=A0A062TUP8_9PROT|nr:hypothetical protein HY2_03795 [Hyphomonas pacifica]RAN31648.1 hypothetical protein HY3_03490 [Hyphomonas pacifica]